MAVLLIATGPVLTLIAQHTLWNADRKQLSLIPHVGDDTQVWSNTILPSNDAERGGDFSKLRSPHNGPGQPPAI